MTGQDGGYVESWWGGYIEPLRPFKLCGDSGPLVVGVMSNAPDLMRAYWHSQADAHQAHGHRPLAA